MRRPIAMLLALILTMSCLPVTTLADTPEAHIHCDCGKQKTLDALCESCGTKAVVWTATDTVPTAEGHYYLTKGVSAQGVEYKDGVKIAICLHGQDITSTSGGQIMAVSGGAELTVTDCTQQSGKITGATSYAYGSALRVKKGGTLILRGGKISGNTAPASGDGTIYVDKGDATTDGGKLYMYGGEISGNSARRGAGIFTVNPGTAKPGRVYILGGTITGNEAKGTGSTKGGGGILAFTPIVVGGDAVISGNTAKEGPADIYLRNSGTFTGVLQLSAEKPLIGGAKIGVGSDTEATDDPTNITAITGTPDQWSCDWLTYAGQSVSYVNGKFVAGHYHGDKLYTPISTNTELANATGYGYLTTDLNLGGPQTRKKDLNLCLNGHTITAKKDKRIFTSAKDAGFTFAIEDCTAYTDAAGVYHAGKLTGGSDTGVNGGGAIYLAAGNTLHIYDGIITGNNATAHGGAMTIMGTLYVHGGKITGNTTGGIYGAAGAKVYVDGDPCIFDNTGSNLYLCGSDLLNVGTLEQSARIGVSVEAGDRTISTACPDYRANILSDDPDYTMQYRDGALYLAAPITHVHCICGSAACTEHESVGFTEWTADDSLPGSGNYCLTKDVTLTKAVAVNGVLNLCLNGHTITQTGADRVFKLDVGPLSITDCGQGGKLVGGTNDYGAAIVVMEGTTFNLYGGTITGSQPAKPDKAGTGAAIFLRSSNAAGATFQMYGGEISGNGNDLTWGGAITNGSGNANNAVYVNIHGGKITGNKAGDGGAIRLENKGTLTITGGEISGNTTVGSGGAVYLSNGFRLDLQGGSISGNTAVLGGGIYANSSAGEVKISGNPTVTDNTVDGKQNNLYLQGDQIITLGAVGTDAKIGVSAAKTGRAVSTQSDTNYTANFVSDSNFYSIGYQDKVLFLDVATNHQHCVCNSSAAACDHTQQKWMPWDSTNSLPTASGYYYLVSDVQLSALSRTEADQKIFLCLNGKTVTAPENTGHMIISKGTELSVTDCGDAPGGFTGGNKAYGGVVNVLAGATLNLYGGELYGNSAAGSEGGAIYLQGGNSAGVPGGILNMYGGTIRDNIAGVGGAIRAAGLGEGGTIPSQVNIYGGTISGNKTFYKLDDQGQKTDIQGEGGAIAVTGGTVLTIYGGIIEKNVAEDDGGAIYANGKAQVLLKGGKLSNNEALRYGGAVFTTAEGTAITMDGGEMTGNKALSGGAVMIQSRSVFTLNDGIIGGNNTTGSGAGLYISTNTEFVMNGGKIAENAADGSGGGIYALRAKVTLNGGEISANKAKVRGGAFVASGAEMTIGKVTISGNAAKEGGAAYINRSSTKKADGTSDHYPSAVTINEGAVITGNKGETNSGGLIIANDDVTLIMNGGEISKNTAASGGAVMTWAGATFTMKGGRVTGNSSTGSGGALYISTDSTFKLSGGEISGNTAKGNGGAMYALASKIVMTGGKISNNTATSAGAVFLLRAEADFAGGSVSGNHAKAITSVSGGVEKTTGGTAGAVYISGATANMRGTSFTGNKADVNGGAIVMGRSSYTKNGVKQTKDAAMNISAGSFSGNTAGKVGGAMLLQSTGTVVKMTGGTITENTSKNAGGGIYASTNTTFTMTGGSIVKNRAEAAGGGMYVLRAKVTITGGELNSNTAATSGAQMVVGGDTADVYLKDMKLHSGQAKIAGGVVVQSDGKFIAENCEFYNNKTTTNSGAVYISTRTSGNFINCKFYDNTTATSGGALTAMNFSEVNITGCTFENNKAETTGGAIYATAASLTTIEDTVIRNCTAQERGGAITCRGSMFLRNSVIENCAAKAEGGAVYTDTNTAGGSGAQRGLVVEGSQIRNNTSGGKGGAFYVYKGCRLEVYDSRITDNTAPAEGGAIWAYEDLELHNTEITGNSSGGDGYAVYKADANYDGHSYTASVNKLSGSVIIKDNQGGDLWMGKDVVFAIAGTGLGENTHIQVTLDSGILTSRILGAYNYEGGDQVYTITYGTRSMTEPEMLPTEPTEAPEAQPTTEATQPTEEGADNTLLYVGIGGIGAVIVIAAVAVVLVKKKKSPQGATKE